MIEKDVEKYLTEKIKKLGGLSFKFTSPGNRGVPDRLIIYQGQIYLVELKRPGEDLRPSQEVVKRRIEKQGVPVYVIDSKLGVNCFIKGVTA